jgi:23S rRNA (cytosine1962-C5)-methyltransferase
MASVQLKPGREKSLLRHHPWIYSGAISALHGEIGNGETVNVLDASGNLLAKGAYSQKSQIKVRIWTWDLDEEIDEVFFKNRLLGAIDFRQGFEDFIHSNACRLVHAESDGLPGLIVDRYGDTLVVQILSSGPEYWRDLIADLLMDLTGAECVYERSDVDVRKLEGLSSRTGVLRGSEPPPLVEIMENGIRFLVDVHAGHKTGFYLDQCTNRRRIRTLARQCQVLDCFAYTGGFTVSALVGEASHVTMVESSGNALEVAKANLALNQLSQKDVDLIEGDVFVQLRKFRDRRICFDLIVLDPPKFAPTASQAQRAARGYKDINLLALKLLKPGGMLVTFSCSGGVSQELFQKIVASAALDAGVEAQILDYLHQGYDHPIGLNFPEGAYLKGFVIRVV